MPRMSSSSWAWASGVTSTVDPLGRPGCRCAGSRSRACRPAAARGRPRRAGRRRRPPPPARRRRPRRPRRNASGCGFTTWISRGVDVAVDQVEDAVALEHLAVVVAAPDRVGQHADLEAARRAAPPRAGAPAGRCGCAAPRTPGMPRAPGGAGRGPGRSPRPRGSPRSRRSRGCRGPAAQARSSAAWMRTASESASARSSAGMSGSSTGQAVHLAGEDPPLLAAGRRRATGVSVPPQSKIDRARAARWLTERRPPSGRACRGPRGRPRRRRRPPGPRGARRWRGP